MLSQARRYAPACFVATGSEGTATINAFKCWRCDHLQANVAQNVTADTDATDLTESSQYGIDNTQIVTDDNGDFELILCAKRPPGCVVSSSHLPLHCWRRLGPALLFLNLCFVNRCTNWLRIDRDTTRLCVRQTFLDASSETRANLQVECLEARGRTRPPLTAAELVKQLRAVHLFVHGVVRPQNSRCAD